MSTSNYPAVRAPFALLAFGLLSALAACQKTERIATTEERLKSVQQQQETKPDFYVPRKTVDYMADLKNVKDAPPPPAPVKAEPAKAAPASPTPVPAPAPVVAAPVVQQPAPTPVKAPEPAPTVVAAAPQTARPTPAAPAPSSAISVVSREQPDFPKEAVRAGVQNGVVRAKLTVAANGDVTDVTILSARPARVFDRVVKASLQHWKFNAGTDGRTYETDITFQLAQ